MLVGRCSWELSGRKTTPEEKKVTNPERSRGICSSADLSWKRFSRERSGAERSAVSISALLEGTEL
jgi:hypothetical protein